jgi:hypothetical protein
MNHEAPEGKEPIAAYGHQAVSLWDMLTVMSGSGALGGALAAAKSAWPGHLGRCITIGGKGCARLGYLH